MELLNAGTSLSLTVRPATPNDAALIADISRQSFYDTFAPDNTKENMDKFLAQQFTREGLMMELGLRENAFFLAYVGNEIAGYLKLRVGKKPAGLNGTGIEVARLYAMKDFIGKGVGRLLMQTAVDEALRTEKDAVWLCVWEHNERAIAFYTAWGFEKFGECDFVLGNDVQKDWMMRKRIC